MADGVGEVEGTRLSDLHPFEHLRKPFHWIAAPHLKPVLNPIEAEHLPAAGHAAALEKDPIPVGRRPLDRGPLSLLPPHGFQHPLETFLLHGHLAQGHAETLVVSQLHHRFQRGPEAKGEGVTFRYFPLRLVDDSETRLTQTLWIDLTGERLHRLVEDRIGAKALLHHRVWSLSSAESRDGGPAGNPTGRGLHGPLDTISCDLHAHGRNMILAGACLDLQGTAPNHGRDYITRREPSPRSGPKTPGRPRLGPSKWSGRWDLNPRPSPWQGDVLPLNYTRSFPPIIAPGEIQRNDHGEGGTRTHTDLST